MKLAILLFSIILLGACGQDKSPTTEKMTDTMPVAEKDSLSTNEEYSIHLDYPALYSNWEIGNKENINIILNMYKDWDDTNIAAMENVFADSVTLDMPDGNRIKSTKQGVINRLKKFRSSYSSTANKVLAIYPLKNMETDGEWVNALVYNKWTYKNNKRDSIMYQDLWRVKDGKINYLLSLEHTISRMQLQGLEKMSETLENKK